MFPIFTITHALLSFTKTVLTNSPTDTTNPKEGFPKWILISIIILLGLCALFLIIYLIRIVTKRKKRRVNENGKKAFAKKEENVEEAGVAPDATTRALTGIDLNSFAEKENQTASERTITENDQSSLLKEEDQSTPVDFIDENYSTAKVGEDTPSIGTLSDHENNSELKKDDEAYFINNPEDLKTEEIEERNLNHEDEFEGEQKADGNNLLYHQEEQEATVVQEETEVQEQIPEKMNISEIFKNEVPDLPDMKEDFVEENLAKETIKETDITRDNEKDEALVNTLTLKKEQPKNIKEAVTEEVAVKEVFLTNHTKEILYDSEMSQTTTFSEISSDEQNEENLNSEEYLAYVKARKGLCSRKFSRISSSVLRNARKNVENSSTEDEY